MTITLWIVVDLGGWGMSDREATPMKFVEMFSYKEDAQEYLDTHDGNLVIVEAHQ